MKTVFPTFPEPFDEKYVVCNTKDASVWLQGYGSFHQLRSITKGDPNLDNNSFVEIEFEEVPSSDIFFLCKTEIPLDVLYRASSLNAKVSSSHDMKFQIGLYDRMQTGPVWDEVEIRANDEEVTISHPLSRPGYSKIEWLIRPYEYIPIFIRDHGQPDSLTITVYEVYLN